MRRGYSQIETKRVSASNNQPRTLWTISLPLYRYGRAPAGSFPDEHELYTHSRICNQLVSSHRSN
jgi:hypothetical protein